MKYSPLLIVPTVLLLLGQGCQPSVKTPDRTEGSSTATETRMIESLEGGFSPNEIKIASGTTVLFVNRTNRPVWVASDPHPSHDNLPEFDAKKRIGFGETYAFTFTEAGSWNFHDHLSPGTKGRVIVE